MTELDFVRDAAEGRVLAGEGEGGRVGVDGQQAALGAFDGEAYGDAAGAGADVADARLGRIPDFALVKDELDELFRSASGYDVLNTYC